MRLVLAALLSLLPLATGAQDSTAARMRTAMEAFTASLPATLRTRLELPFASEKRTDWHYTPRSRPGISLADLDAAQRAALHKLLRTGLSAAGHRRVTNIIELELVLRELETFGALMRDPDKYFLVVFRDPADAQWRAPWGWRFEGHHLSLSFTIRGERVSSTPSFFGANPAQVRQGPKRGLRALGEEEDEGRKLLAMLDASQRAQAVVDTRPYGDIVSRAVEQASPLDNRGIEARSLDDAQKAQLHRLVETYAASFEPALREARLARAADGFEAIRFAWAGAVERGRPHYYRVQGPKFLIEFDASQDGGNHVHTVWRDYGGDFGRDLLREHHSVAHGKRGQSRAMPSSAITLFTAERASTRSAWAE
jgi:hypothetical protein